MLRTILLTCILGVMLGCGGGADPLNPPDAPAIPPGRSTGAPAMPAAPGQPAPGSRVPGQPVPLVPAR